MPGLMEALIPREDESHGSTIKNPDELRERAIRMAMDLRRDPATRSGALQRPVESTEYVIPGFATEHDIDEVVALADHCNFLIMAAENDRWSRGADWLQQQWDIRQQTPVKLETRRGEDGFHPRCERAYRFLRDHLNDIG